MGKPRFNVANGLRRSQRKFLVSWRRLRKALPDPSTAEERFNAALSEYLDSFRTTLAAGNYTEAYASAKSCLATIDEAQQDPDFVKAERAALDHLGLSYAKLLELPQSRDPDRVESIGRTPEQLVAHLNAAFVYEKGRVVGSRRQSRQKKKQTRRLAGTKAQALAFGAGVIATNVTLAEDFDQRATSIMIGLSIVSAAVAARGLG